MAVDYLSKSARERQCEALQRAYASGCTKKEIASNIYFVDKRTFLRWLARKAPALVTSDAYQTYTPAEVKLIVDALGDPTIHKVKFYENLK